MFTIEISIFIHGKIKIHTTNKTVRRIEHIYRFTRCTRRKRNFVFGCRICMFIDTLRETMTQFGGFFIKSSETQVNVRH